MADIEHLQARMGDDNYHFRITEVAGKTSKPGMIGRGLNWLDQKTKAVGGALSNFGHQFTTDVTKEKLKMNWHQAGKPSDSDQLAAWLVTQKVPQQVVTSVFSKMSIPYTAPATAQPAGQSASPAVSGKAEREMWGGNLLKDPDTGKSYTVDKIQRGLSPAASATNTAATNTAPAPTATKTTAGGTFPGEDPQGPGYVGRREVARRQAARDAEASKKPAAPNFAQQGGGYKSVNYAPNIKTGINLPKSTAPATPTTTSGTGGTYDKKTGAATLDGKPMIAAKDLPPNIQKQLSGRKEALTQPVTELLQMVETKEDVQRIKQFVDDTFVKYGAVNESAFALRNQILEHVTQAGAQRRREHSQRVAH
jgi:hypothetical protein